MGGGTFYVNDQAAAAGRFYHNTSGSSPLRLPPTKLSTLHVSASGTSVITITAISIDPSESWE
jgi:hypothetical protein